MASKGILQTLPDLLSRDSFEVGCLEDVVDDSGIALALLGGYCYQVVLFRGLGCEASLCKGVLGSLQGVLMMVWCWSQDNYFVLWRVVQEKVDAEAARVQL